MPAYSYRCDKCGKRFSVTMPITEHGNRRLRCPKCGSLRVVQRISSFFAQTSKKS